MPSSVPTGSVIGAFRVRSLIGAGAMGSVYLAENTRTGEPVALKLLAPELAGDERFRQRFARESALAATLEHPNIVRIVSSGEADGLLFLAMAVAAFKEAARRVADALSGDLTETREAP